MPWDCNDPRAWPVARDDKEYASYAGLVTGQQARERGCRVVLGLYRQVDDDHVMAMPLIFVGAGAALARGIHPGWYAAVSEGERIFPCVTAPYADAVAQIAGSSHPLSVVTAEVYLDGAPSGSPVCFTQASRAGSEHLFWGFVDVASSAGGGSGYVKGRSFEIRSSARESRRWSGASCGRGEGVPGAVCMVVKSASLEEKGYENTPYFSSTLATRGYEVDEELRDQFDENKPEFTIAAGQRFNCAGLHMCPNAVKQVGERALLKVHIYLRSESWIKRNITLPMTMRGRIKDSPTECILNTSRLNLRSAPLKRDGISKRRPFVAYRHGGAIRRGGSAIKRPIIKYNHSSPEERGTQPLRT